MARKSSTATALLEKRFASPAVSARKGVFVIALFVLVMAGWGAAAPLSSAVVANGVLQVEGGRQAVQHPYGGVVEQLMVAEGDRVEAGDILMRLSDADPRARLDVLQAERDARLAAQGRLVAERDGLAEPAFPQALLERADEASALEAMASEEALMAARLEQFETSRGVLEQRAAQLDERVTAAQAQISGLVEQRESIEAELADARDLLEQQLVERSRVSALERNLSDLQSQISVLETEITSARKAMSEAQLEIVSLERTRVAEESQALRETQASLSELTPQIAAAQDALSRTDIVAPVSGQVVDQTVVTEGGVVAAGERILDVVPVSDPLLVEARMRLEDISAVERGARADVRLLAVPASTRPELSGTVDTVSADRLVNERSGQGYYALRVALDRSRVAALGLDLQAGMPVQVIIPTRSRTMIDYLVSPLLDEINGAFRER